VSNTTTIRRKPQRGEAMLELSLVFVPLFAMVAGIADVSMNVFVKCSLQSAVREGVRYAVTYRVMDGLCQDASIKKVVQNNTLGMLSSASDLEKIHVRYYNPANLSVEVTGAGSNFPGNVVEVSVEGYQRGWILPLLHQGLPINMNVYAADRMESLASGAQPPCR